MIGQKNQVTYYGDDSILSPKVQLESEWLTGVRPILEPNIENTGKHEIVSILIVGESMSAGEKTGIPVGAYVDLFMIPNHVRVSQFTKVKGWFQNVPHSTSLFRRSR